MSLEDFTKDRHALALLQAMLDGTIPDVREVRHLETRLSYLPAERELPITHDKLSELLERLTRSGLLRKVTYDNALSCPKCNSIEITSELFCPRCQGVNLEKEILIEHYKCGFNGSESSFRSGQDYVCPKCNKTLTQIGVDYQRLGVAYECTHCQEKFTEPVEKWTCQDCENRFETKEASLRYLHIFKLADNAKTSLHQYLFDTEKVVDFLRSAGYDVQSPASLTGESGLVHKFDIRLEKTQREKGENPTLVRVFRAPNEVTYQEILAFYAEALDLKSSRLVAVAIPHLQSEGRQYASTHQIGVIEAEKPQDVIEKLKELLGSRSENADVFSREVTT